MPRRRRIAAGGVVFHAVNRAVAREKIFWKPADYEAFETVLEQAGKRGPMRLLFSPRQLSFATAVQTVAASWMTLPLANGSPAFALVITQLDSLAQQQVGDRPNRVDPRAVKRRPKPYRLLTKSREVARAELPRGVQEAEARKVA